MYKILIVEDEDIIRKGLVFMVDWQKLGCVVIGEASDGQEGYQKIIELKPDIVLSDIRMPIMDGLEMIEKALKEESFYTILLSGYNEFEYARTGIRLGVEEYLLKPVDFKELEKAIIQIEEKLSEARITGTEGAVIQLIEEEVLNRPVSSRRVAALIREVKENYSQRLVLRELGEKYEMSPSYMNSKFKKEVGYTFNDFLNRYRIMKANELLQTQPHLKIYEIAERVGFSDYKYFIKVFKKYVGYPPLQMYHHFGKEL